MREDAIQQSGNQVSVVIYDAPLPPRYFRFSKKFIRILFVVVPFLLGLTFLGLLIWGLGIRVKDAPVPTLPDALSDQDAKVLALEEEVKGLNESLTKMSDKLATQSANGAVEDPYLMAIKKPYGMQNFLNENRVNLGQLEFVPEPNKTTLKFQIISTNPETKVTGHVLVFMVSEAGLMAYPADANKNLSAGVKYSMGEPFAVSRLRPTNAEFNHRVAGDAVKFHIYIFTREGDLLLIRETESYKVGNRP